MCLLLLITSVLTKIPFGENYVAHSSLQEGDEGSFWGFTLKQLDQYQVQPLSIYLCRII